MDKHQMENHIWLASLFHYLYPMFIEKKLIDDSDTETLYMQTIHSLSNKNRFFQKYYQNLSSDQSNISIINFFVRRASQLSTLEYGIHDGTKVNNFVPLQSIFSNLFDQQQKKSFMYPLKPLELSNILPSENVHSDSIGQLFSSFLKELEKIHKKEQLLFLLEKYFWSVADANTVDISLYDLMKTNAAIACSLYKQYEKGYLDIKEFNESSDRSTKQFMLIHGDVSGIQNFIFNIPSKGAAKSLKGRSVYISLLSDVIVRYILDELELHSTSLLYNGGGNFFILAPYCQQEKFVSIREKILQHLLEGHDGEIYFAIDFVPVSMADFQDFSSVWESSKTKTSRLKKRKWSELGLESKFKEIFGPLDKGNDESHVCKVCGSFGSKRPINEEFFDDDDSMAVCTMCKSFINLTNELRDAAYLVFRKATSNDLDYNTYQDMFRQFGYDISFYSNMNQYSPNKQEQWYKINDTNFVEDHCDGFQFGAYFLPQGKDGQVTFEELSQRAIVNGRGDAKLAHLKLDVDNLGMIFGQGLGERSSISRVSVLSRMLGLYFGGYINQLIEEHRWQEKLYVVFSGGDDTYVVGTWKDVFAFAEKFYQDFRLFTCQNRYITFSAGMNVFSYQFPVTRAADITENSLEAAKKASGISNGNFPPIKNKVSLMGEVFNWEEFKQVKEIESILEKMVIEYDNRSVLYKVNKSTLGFKHILKDSTQGKFQHVKFWRLYYYLRDIKKNYNYRCKKFGKEAAGEDYVEQLVHQYRQIVVHNLFHSKERDQIRKIMIIPVAVKWAELATRKAEEENE
ncbi:type III-A CRISPR-associated protein Cas10/Csm1 [Aeribacillus composti]|uniref:CRISPR system single-strand-specific deoxyribonuclease Cas10/Csm1 (subtype III-A) n=1 Tax=Aeribacillus composti TaxID=1868734 RepID=A0ABY9WF68_9BACI|nr:type III-A CRISPR-associated protein Cas10/Csm1 [Aeribacillus composti]MED1441502.1 type III-A CRISPR-associated protein Cas10/Csm1 [Aeribacillus composti]WNF33862.1 type III-A CRISPR-associated protein Cas10/Csm1 [Aeribacillus composti]